MGFKRDYTIYDVIGKREILIPKGNVISIAKSLGFDYTALSKFSRKSFILNRYILPDAKDLVFTLVDIETGIEYDCITNKTIFIHLDQPYSGNDAKYVYGLRKRRQGRATVCSRLFTLKGGYEARITSRAKVLPESFKPIIEERRLRTKIKNNIYCRVRRAINDYAGGYKSLKTQELLGCSIESFKNYIESKFTKNMGWGNRNLWHIDHIAPCVKFNLLDDEEQKRCFHYTNLQPIWKTTEIALEMGEAEYEGNQNKNDRGEEYDYHILDILRSNPKFPISIEQAKQMAVAMFDFGIKRVLPEHTHLYD